MNPLSNIPATSIQRQIDSGNVNPATIKHGEFIALAYIAMLRGPECYDKLKATLDSRCTNVERVS